MEPIIIEHLDDGKTFAHLADLFLDECECRWVEGDRIFVRADFVNVLYTIDGGPGGYRLMAFWEDDYFVILAHSFHGMLDAVFGAETSPEKVLIKLTYA